MKKLNQRVCAVCGKTDWQSKKATSPFTRLLAFLVKDHKIILRRPDSQFAHADCIDKARKRQKGNLR